MTKLIGAVIIILVLWGAWEIWLYWDEVSRDQEVKARQAEASKITNGDQLSGMPGGLEPSFQAARSGGPAALRTWLKRYGQSVQDPRRAWIELDYMVSIARDEPVEARKIFAEVKSRVTENSPVYSRVKDLENTYK